jgi:hypothetical protein
VMQGDVPTIFWRMRMRSDRCPSMSSWSIFGHVGGRLNARAVLAHGDAEPRLPRSDLRGRPTCPRYFNIRFRCVGRCEFVAAHAYSHRAI